MPGKPPRFLDYLPAIFQQDAKAGNNFLGQFLQPFETLFEGIQRELDAIPDLFSLVPAPTLATAANQGATTLDLDSAAGLGAGDVLQVLDGDLNRIEFVAIQTLPSELLPTRVQLLQPLRFDHPPGTPLLMVGRAERSLSLSLSVNRGGTQLSLVDAPGLGVVVGDVLRMGEATLTEYGRVVGVNGATIVITPPLQNPHMLGTPVALMQQSATTTPPLTFAFSDRRGSELVLRALALPGEQWVELDSINGLVVGDVLHFQEAVPAQVEFAQIRALAVEQSGAAVLREAVQLHQPLRFSHAVGTSIAVLSGVNGATRLLSVVNPGEITIEAGDTFGVISGDVLQLGEANSVEYVQVLTVSGQRLTVTPPLQQNHPADQPIRKINPAGSGIGLIEWLGSWIGTPLRRDRGERWNREWLRLGGRLQPWSGTAAGVAAALKTYLRGEVQQVNIFDAANPLQIGLVSTVGVDTVINGNPPSFFWVDLVANPRNSALYSAEGFATFIQTAQETIRQGKPAHTDYDLRIQAHPMQIGVDPELEIGARIGRTTLLADAPLVISDDPARKESTI